MQNAPVSDLCSKGVFVFSVVCLGHTVLVLFTCEPSHNGLVRPWLLDLFVASAIEDTLRITCPGICRLARGENEGTLEYCGCMFQLNLQAVLAMDNSKYHRGAPGGGDAGLQPPPPNSKFQKHIL